MNEVLEQIRLDMIRKMMKEIDDNIIAGLKAEARFSKDTILDDQRTKPSTDKGQWNWDKDSTETISVKHKIWS